MAPGIQISAIDELIQAQTAIAGHGSDLERHLQALALQVQHNLQHQHDWESVLIHTHSPVAASVKLPRPLLSGLPPHPIYVHPDKQIELIKAGVEEHDMPSRREWVLPTLLREKWTLRRFAEVFDRIDKMPTNSDGVQEEDPYVKEPKRVLLATVDDDSTVTYYVVHDGIVKPRQN